MGSAMMGTTDDSTGAAGMLPVFFGSGPCMRSAVYLTGWCFYGFSRSCSLLLCEACSGKSGEQKSAGEGFELHEM